VSFISDFMLISIQHVAVKFKSNGGVDHNKQPCMCSQGRFLSGEYRDFTCVDTEAYTVGENS